SIMRFVLRISWLQRSQAHGSEEFAFDYPDYRLLLVAVEQRMRQAHRENLVGTKLRHGAVWRNYIVQTQSRFVPEEPAKTHSHGVGFLRIILRSTLVV